MISTTGSYVEAAAFRFGAVAKVSVSTILRLSDETAAHGDSPVGGCLPVDSFCLKVLLPKNWIISQKV